MTAPTPKPDGALAPRRFRIPRYAALGASAVLVFAICVIALVPVLPAPRTRAGYLMVGSLATLASLITIFAGLLLGSRKRLPPR